MMGTGCCAVEGDPRWTLKPTAVPRTTGSAMDAAGCWKMKLGMVREGMWVVMVIY
jgi:hypothetical protein